MLRSTNRLIVEDVNVGDRMLYSKGDEDKVKNATKAPVDSLLERQPRLSRHELTDEGRSAILDDGTRVRVSVNRARSSRSPLS